MPDVNDMELLGDYARNGSETAFAELIRRHIPLVYSAALRQVGIAAHAEEITQGVFIILARKAGTLRPATILEGWLYETTRLTALSFLRGERRRQFREQEAYMQSTLRDPNENLAWNEISPLLDEALARLGKKDRDAVILRFFKEKSVRDVAATMQVNESAAQRRILRALEKLRNFFVTRGIHPTTETLAAAIAVCSIQPVPPVLANSVAAVAVAKGTAASTSTLTLIKGALKLMAWTKAKTAISAGVIVLLATATTTVTVKHIQSRPYPWQMLPFDVKMVNNVPPQVRIVSSRFSRPQGSMMDGNEKMMGLGQPLWTLFPNTYHISWWHVVYEVPLPAGRYDFIANLPQGSPEALQREIEAKFNLSAKRETIITNVLLLTLQNAAAPGLKPAHPNPMYKNYTGSFSEGEGEFWCKSNPISTVASFLEAWFEIPVVDGTGLAGKFDINLKWDSRNDPEHENLKKVLLDQLGLAVVPTNMPVEMLVVTKR